MCYSAQASFFIGGYLLLAGLWSLRQNRRPKLRMFAAMPFIFALQQGIEGFLWLQTSPSELTSLAPYLYLFLAFFVWPIFIPMSIFFAEPNPHIIPHLKRLALLGAGVSTTLYAYVLRFGTSAEPTLCHMYYNIHIPNTVRAVLTLLYLSVTVIPFIISSIPFMPLFGTLLLASYFLTYYFYFSHILSVWCFFAAILSSFVCVIVTQQNKKK
jgi:hypothetical protein